MCQCLSDLCGDFLNCQYSYSRTFGPHLHGCQPVLGPVTVTPLPPTVGLSGPLRLAPPSLCPPARLISGQAPWPIPWSLPSLLTPTPPNPSHFRSAVLLARDAGALVQPLEVGQLGAGVDLPVVRHGPHRVLGAGGSAARRQRTAGANPRWDEPPSHPPPSERISKLGSLPVVTRWEMKSVSEKKIAGCGKW